MKFPVCRRIFDIYSQELLKQFSLAQANFCSRLLQLSEFPWCKDSPQIENTFFSDYHGPKPDLYKRYIDDCAGVTSSSREGLLFITSVSFLFLLALKYNWEISENSFIYLTSTLNFQSTTTVYLLAYTTNELMLITICCIGPFIHIMLKIPFHFLNFSY